MVVRCSYRAISECLSLRQNPKRPTLPCVKSGVCFLTGLHEVGSLYRRYGRAKSVCETACACWKIRQGRFVRRERKTARIAALFDKDGFQDADIGDRPVGVIRRCGLDAPDYVHAFNHLSDTV